MLQQGSFGSYMGQEVEFTSVCVFWLETVKLLTAFSQLIVRKKLVWHGGFRKNWKKREKREKREKVKK